MNIEKKNKPGMYEYLKRLIPSGATINFVFNEDFNGDGLKEALVGFTQFIPFPPESSIVYLENSENGFKHYELLSKLLNEGGSCGIYDNAGIADLNKDGLPELVLSLASGNGRYSILYIFDFKDGTPHLSWKSEESFLNGSMEIIDSYDDGIVRIIADSGTFEGKELIGLDEACYHMRKSTCYEWDGFAYKGSEHQVRMPYRSYNTSVEFLLHLLMHEYKKAYDMVLLPGFIGLKGLDNSNLEAFRKYVTRQIMPVLQRNLARKKFIPSEPYEDFCLFNGVYEDIAVELITRGKKLLIQAVNIYKKT